MWWWRVLGGTKEGQRVEEDDEDEGRGARPEREKKKGLRVPCLVRDRLSTLEARPATG